MLVRLEATPQKEILALKIAKLNALVNIFQESKDANIAELKSWFDNPTVVKLNSGATTSLAELEKLARKKISKIDTSKTSEDAVARNQKRLSEITVLTNTIRQYLRQRNTEINNAKSFADILAMALEKANEVPPEVKEAEIKKQEEAKRIADEKQKAEHIQRIEMARVEIFAFIKLSAKEGMLNLEEKEDLEPTEEQLITWLKAIKFFAQTKNTSEPKSAEDAKTEFKAQTIAPAPLKSQSTDETKASLPSYRLLSWIPTSLNPLRLFSAGPVALVPETSQKTAVVATPAQPNETDTKQEILLYFIKTLLQLDLDKTDTLAVKTAFFTAISQKASDETQKKLLQFLQIAITVNLVDAKDIPAAPSSDEMIIIFKSIQQAALAQIDAMDLKPTLDDLSSFSSTPELKTVASFYVALKSIRFEKPENLNTALSNLQQTFNIVLNPKNLNISESEQLLQTIKKILIDNAKCMVSNSHYLLTSGTFVKANALRDQALACIDEKGAPQEKLAKLSQMLQTHLLFDIRNLPDHQQDQTPKIHNVAELKLFKEPSNKIFAAIYFALQSLPHHAVLSELENAMKAINPQWDSQKPSFAIPEETRGSLLGLLPWRRES